jgi:hypothetical protein
MTILGAHGVSIAQVVQDGAPGAGQASGEPVWVVVLTHEAREGSLRAALAEIAGLPAMRTEPRVIRIAG